MKYLTGYDLRLNFKNAPILWDNKRRETYLLNEKIAFPLSVDKYVWPSIFKYKNLNNDPTQIYIVPQNLRHEIFELWENENDMAEYANEKNIKLAVVIHLNNKVIKKIKYNLFYSLLNPIKIKKKWLLLGYDVADINRISGLSNCGYNQHDKILIQEKWQPHLNEYGLFNSFKKSINFCSFTNKRVPEHAPFFVYSLYLFDV